MPERNGKGLWEPNADDLKRAESARQDTERYRRHQLYIPREGDRPPRREPNRKADK